MAEVVQVSRLLDQRGLSSFHYSLMFWCVLLSLIDGYDIAAIAFAAPHLVREWGIQRGALGLVFSASLIGLLVRLCDIRLDRRPLRPQDRADLRQFAVRRIHLRRRLFDQP